MRTLMTILVSIMFSVAVKADVPKATTQLVPPTLLQRALQNSERDQPARPIGQCLFACGAGVIEVDLCPTGDCPDYDCRTGLASCPTRQ